MTWRPIRRPPTTTTPTPAGCSSTRSASRRSAARRRSSIRGCGRARLAAALVHDVGRTIELTRGPAFTPTEEGRLLGHVHLGLRLIDARAEGLTAGQLAELLHCVAAHHDLRAATDGRGGRRSTTRTSSTRSPPPGRPGERPFYSRSARASPGGSPTSSAPGRDGHSERSASCSGPRSAGSGPSAIVCAARGRGTARLRPSCSRSRQRSPATLGLYAYYRGMATGAMSVVAPIAGASAIVPVIFGIADGDRPRPLQFPGIACGARRRRARLAGAPGGRQAQRRRRRRARAPRCDRFRLLLPADARGRSRPTRGGARSIFRLTATAIVLPAVAVRRPRSGSRGWTLLIVLGVGLGDTLGNAALRRRRSPGGLVSLTSVLASLYPIVTVLLAAARPHERVAPMQRVGVVADPRRGRAHRVVAWLRR